MLIRKNARPIYDLFFEENEYDDVINALSKGKITDYEVSENKNRISIYTCDSKSFEKFLKFCSKYKIL